MHPSRPLNPLNKPLLCEQAVFVLPTSYPVTPSTLNYSGVAVGILLICVVAWWWSPIWGAREWYNGAKGEHIAAYHTCYTIPSVTSLPCYCMGIPSGTTNANRRETCNVLRVA